MNYSSLLVLIVSGPSHNTKYRLSNFKTPHSLSALTKSPNSEIQSNLLPMCPVKSKQVPLLPTYNGTKYIFPFQTERRGNRKERKPRRKQDGNPAEQHKTLQLHISSIQHLVFMMRLAQLQNFGSSRSSGPTVRTACGFSPQLSLVASLNLLLFDLGCSLKSESVTPLTLQSCIFHASKTSTRGMAQFGYHLEMELALLGQL